VISPSALSALRFVSARLTAGAPSATFREKDFEGFGLFGCQQCYQFGAGLRDGFDAKMQDEEWIKTLEDGRKVKFICQELPDDGAFITAQLAGNEVVYSIILTNAKNPLRREDVEGHFKGELSKK
jgi:hypothetical protein